MSIINGIKFTVMPIYQHYKGEHYWLMGSCQRHGTREVMAVYRSLRTGEDWIRPLDEFNAFITKDGKYTPRFRKCPKEEEPMYWGILYELNATNRENGKD